MRKVAKEEAGRTSVEEACPSMQKVAKEALSDISYFRFKEANSEF